MAARRLPLFIGPFISRRIAGKVTDGLSAEADTRTVAIAPGPGGSSAHTWLKLPVTDDADDIREVLETSTLPAVLPGGEAGGSAADQAGAYERWRKALAPPTVRGPVAGRSLLHPARGSVETAVDTAVGLL